MKNLATWTPALPINQQQHQQSSIQIAPIASMANPSSTTTTSTSTTTTTTTPSTVIQEQQQQQQHQQTTQQNNHLAAKCLRCVANGGRCNPDGRCQCPAGFYGPQCKPLPVTSLSMDSKCRASNGTISEDCGQPIERQCDDKIDNDNGKFVFI